ncbi:hypothetical protein GTP81_20330 [Rugamonas sp. FT107W]|uniref:Sodium:proton antiporter n=1 Tax=Duganella vulcania TaxID=2692166 RepID=A0A845HIE7_9BURK|nr:hypothetical protein [Duganella vulcania]
MRNIIEEARMVLPGIQALFGFQTVAVFNQRFDALPAAVQAVHLLALATVVIAIALIMTPAAWHRIVSPQRVSESIVKLSSRMICAALLPLAVGLALDMFVVFYVVSSSVAAGTAAAVLSLALLLTLWFALPLRERRRRR